MKIAIAQINTTIGDIAGNVDKILRIAGQAKAKEVDLIIFPELTITGYPAEDLLLKDSFIQANLAAVDDLAKDLHKLNLAAIIGFVDRNTGRGKPLFNAAAFLKDGQIILRQYKSLLPSYDVFDEDRYFESAKNYQLIELGKLKIGLTICEDAWTADSIEGSYFHGVESIKGRYFIDPIEEIVKLKPNLIINIAASPFAIGKYKVRENLLRQHALKWKQPIIFANQIGGNDELIFDGRSFVLNDNGELVAAASSFEEDLLIVDIDESGKIVSLAKHEQEDKLEIYQAIVLGTRDYVRKCGFSDVILGLSGGIDSAVTAAIACRALGAEHVLGVCMPSPHSSSGSIDDSQHLAQNLGMKTITIPIGEAMEVFDNLLKDAFKDRQADITEENLQARLRAVTLMALSNKFNRLLLTTGNKSELAVGYCTLYGDMCGGLALIADLYKTRVYELAQSINEEAGYDLIPQTIIDKVPSAELRPGQKDQDTLPPYPVLDKILKAYIEDGKSIEKIVKEGNSLQVVEKVVDMVEKNEFKRRQAALGLKLTNKAFGGGWKVPVAKRYRESV